MREIKRILFLASRVIFALSLFIIHNSFAVWDGGVQMRRTRIDRGVQSETSERNSDEFSYCNGEIEDLECYHGHEHENQHEDHEEEEPMYEEQEAVDREEGEDNKFEPLRVICEINGYTVPAIIDTGAEITIMSHSCAKKCRIANTIDTNYAGKAIGVGCGEILGRVNNLAMRIGPLSFHNKVSILRDSRVDFLIGLDFLSRFRCELSFKDSTMRLFVRDQIIPIPLIRDSHLDIRSNMDIDSYCDYDDCNDIPNDDVETDMEEGSEEPWIDMYYDNDNNNYDDSNDSNDSNYDENYDDSYSADYNYNNHKDKDINHNHDEYTDNEYQNNEYLDEVAPLPSPNLPRTGPRLVAMARQKRSYRPQRVQPLENKLSPPTNIQNNRNENDPRADYVAPKPIERFSKKRLSMSGL